MDVDFVLSVIAQKLDIEERFKSTLCGVVNPSKLSLSAWLSLSFLPVSLLFLCWLLSGCHLCGLIRPLNIRTTNKLENATEQSKQSTWQTGKLIILPSDSDNAMLLEPPLRIGARGSSGCRTG